VDAVRADVSNQSVLIDAALIPIHDGMEREHNLFIGAVTLRVQDEEARFWKHLLPAFAERCCQ
jgi:hypothetical protein